MFGLFLFSCWAPELAPPTQEKRERTRSPAEQLQNGQSAQEESQEQPLKPPNMQYSDEEKEELSRQALVPPYTAWTMKENTTILGPNGGVIFKIFKRGTRLEVHKVVPQYAKVLCSGCAPPKQNQAGWINIEDISMEWDMPEHDPLLTMIDLRKSWLKNKETPTEFTDRRAICMLFDNGYVETDSGLLWNIQGGEIILTKKGNSWTTTKTKAPTTTPASSWRCDPPLTPSNQ
jgi:hypothetical protein